MILSSSCVSIPKSSVQLSEEIRKETEEMHKLNITLVQQLFEERRNTINNFIHNKYVPKVVDNYRKLLPEELDYKEQLPSVIKNIIPVILRKKDSLQSLLENQQNQIIGNLNANYEDYNRASYVLHDLITSASKLEAEKRKTMQSIQNLTGQEIDVDKIEKSIVNFHHTIEQNLKVIDTSKKQ
ncbi:hypothetical protein [Tenacibaculum sp. nBUS_03]|uniref:hypothetical protein n=1 Tax=Tenacibaculum sp. nBUS_03 TaxID=3395320 RepID=UPI003EB83EAD